MTERKHVFLDCETTGLDPSRHEVWEIAYAVDDGPILSQIVPHALRDADPKALELGGHDARCGGDLDPRHNPVFEIDLLSVLDGCTLVGANPAFDAAFLTARWGRVPWKYRLLDVEVYAMPALGLTEPKGLAYIAEQLGIDSPDHTAAGDVAVLRRCFRKFQAIYEAGL